MTKAEHGTREVFGIFRVLRLNSVMQLNYELIVDNNKTMYLRNRTLFFCLSIKIDFIFDILLVSLSKQYFSIWDIGFSKKIGRFRDQFWSPWPILVTESPYHLQWGDTENSRSAPVCAGLCRYYTEYRQVPLFRSFYFRWFRQKLRISGISEILINSWIFEGFLVYFMRKNVS